MTAESTITCTIEDPLGAWPIDLAEKGAIRRLFLAGCSVVGRLRAQAGHLEADKHDMKHRRFE
jgi:hypothetical protein